MLEKSNLRHSVDFFHVNLSTTISRPRRSIFLGYIKRTPLRALKQQYESISFPIEE